MKKFAVAISAIAALGCANSANAADMPVKAARVAPPAVFSWTSCYVGGNVGGAWSRVSDDWVANPAGFGGPGFINDTGSHNEDGSGVIAGGQLGCQWQSAQFVYGLEGDFNYTGLSTSRDLTAVSLGAAQIYHSDFRSHWLSTVRARLGLAMNQWLLYATGGLAIADMRYNDSVFFASSGTTTAGSSSQARAGWTVGGGVEYAFNPQWSMKAEYLYVSINGPDYTMVNPVFPLATITANHELREHIARIGLNYHFSSLLP